jgi:hypothetical protein
MDAINEDVIILKIIACIMGLEYIGGGRVEEGFY